jgi:hypothetical protein
MERFSAATIAAVMSLLELAEEWGGWSFGVDQHWIETTLMLLTPFLVWAVPGLRPEARRRP